MQNDKTIWVSDAGDVLCFNHAGHYLKSAITKRPQAITHNTPLDAWSKYALDLPGALPCMECVDWATIEIPA